MVLFVFQRNKALAEIMQNITERKTNEEKLRQQQAELAHLARFALTGEMASGLAMS